MPILLKLALGFLGLIISPAYGLVEQAIDPDNDHGRWAAMLLPAENGTKIAFEQRSISSCFQAEYVYRLRFRQDNEVKYRTLLVNTGGRTCFNVYRLKDGRLLFSDKDADYIVDPQKAEVWNLFRYQDKTYLGLLPQDRFDSWGWSLDENTGVMRVDFGSHQGEAFLLTNELDGKTYYGCITDDFYSADEKPEQVIEKLK